MIQHSHCISGAVREPPQSTCIAECSEGCEAFLIHELAHVYIRLSDLRGFKSRSAAREADFSPLEVLFYYPFETRVVVLGMTCKVCVFAVIVLQL